MAITTKKPNLKTRLFDIFQYAYTGYGALGFLFSMVAYGAIILVTVKLDFPQISGTELSVVGGAVVFTFLSIFGYYYVNKGGYQRTQAFGKRKNPNAMMWELEVIKGRITAEECKIIAQMAKKLNIDTAQLNKELFELKGMQVSMDELLGLKHDEVD